MTAIHVPRPEGEAASRFLKLGARRYLVISIVMTAFTLTFRHGRIAAAGIAVGACAPVATRLRGLEQRLVGRSAGEDLGTLVDEACLAPLAPIDDIRATAAYRRDACLTLLRRGLGKLGTAA
jgi:CO/xanthine dehydrogenase FAD-binding subunit